MADFNSVQLMGRLPRDPELKFLGGGSAVCNFSIAVGRKYKTATGEQREETSFFDCVSFGKGGELINQYFSKGKPIFVTGRMKQEVWEDKTNGGKRSKVVVIVDNFQFIGGKDNCQQQGDDRQQHPADHSQAPADDDEIPFM
jgi:single-strand DNA-binding protein